VTELDDLTKD